MVPRVPSKKQTLLQYLHEFDAATRAQHLRHHGDVGNRDRAEDVDADPHDVPRPCAVVLLDRPRQQCRRRARVLQPRVPRTAGVLGRGEPSVAKWEVERIGHGAAIYARAS